MRWAEQPHSVLQSLFPHVLEAKAFLHLGFILHGIWFFRYRYVVLYVYQDLWMTEDC